MQNTILKAIARITRRKDSLSLQRTMLKALESVFGVIQAQIYSCVKSSGSDVDLKTSCFRFSYGYPVDAVDAMSNKKEFEINTTDKNINIIEASETELKLIIMVKIKNKVHYIIEVLAPIKLKIELDTLSLFAEIYENHVGILYNSEHDKLTGLFNRRTFDARLDHMLLEQKEKKKSHGDKEKRDNVDKSSSWLAMIDIDFFKRVNDNYGHVAGDEVLLQLSQKLKEFFRQTDLLFRFGGEEFVIILEPISKDMAFSILNKLRKSIEAYRFPHVGLVTISIGFAAISEKDFPVTVLDFADKALYFSKQKGRNCVHNYESLLESGMLDEQSEAGEVDLF